MLGMNRATLLGHAGRDPEMRKTQAGDDVARFSLATTERFRRKDDTVGEATEWHAIVAFGPAAEAVRKLVRKGDPVLVEGRISTRSWTDRKTGSERRTTEIVVAGRGSVVNVLAKRRTGQGGSDGSDKTAGEDSVAAGTDSSPAGEADSTAAESGSEAADAADPSDDRE